MTSKEALILLLRSHFGDERAKRKVDKYCDEIENQLLTDLDRLEELEKAFDTLSKDDEKAKKLLSLEIEKNRKLQIIKEKFDIEVFEMKGLGEKVEYIIDIRPKPNKHSNMLGNSLTKEEYDLLKELRKWQ